MWDIDFLDFIVVWTKDEKKIRFEKKLRLEFRFDGWLGFFGRTFPHRHHIRSQQGLFRYLILFYCRRGSYGKVMFSVVSVCPSVILSTGGSHVTINHDALDLTTRVYIPGPSHPRHGTSLYRNPRPPWTCSKLYKRASYWNAFLFRNWFDISCFTIVLSWACH